MPAKAIFLLLCVSLAIAQGSTTDVLNFDSPTEVELPAGAKKEFIMVIPKMASILDLYINVQSPPNDPFQ